MRLKPLIHLSVGRILLDSSFRRRRHLPSIAPRNLNDISNPTRPALTIQNLSRLIRRLGRSQPGIDDLARRAQRYPHSASKCVGDLALARLALHHRIEYVGAVQTTLHGWKLFDPKTPVLTHVHSLRRRFAEEFRNAPPRWLITAHGDVVDFTSMPDAHRSLFGSA